MCWCVRRGYGEELGRLELKVDTDKKAPVSWTWKKDSDRAATRSTPATDVAAQVKIWKDKVAGIVGQAARHGSNRELTRAEARKLLEDAMKEATGADFAFLNAGGVRDTLPKGQLPVRHALECHALRQQDCIRHVQGPRSCLAVVTAGQKIDPDKEYRLAVSDFTARNQDSDRESENDGPAVPRRRGLTARRADRTDP